MRQGESSLTKLSRVYKPLSAWRSYRRQIFTLHLPIKNLLEYISLKGDLRQGVDSPPPGKANGDSFPVDWNARTRIAGQLRQEAGPCRDNIFLFLQVRRLHILKKTIWRWCDGVMQRGVMKSDALPIDLFNRIHLGKRCMYTQGRILRYTKYEL